MGPFGTLKPVIGIKTGATIVDLKYGRDSAGNVTSRTDIRTGQTENFTYDTFDRVTGSRGAPYTEADDYSAIGNLISRTGPVGPMEASSSNLQASRA